MKGQITKAIDLGKPGFRSYIGIFTCRLRSWTCHIFSMFASHM